MELPRFRPATRVLFSALAVASLIQALLAGPASSESLTDTGVRSVPVEFSVSNTQAFPSTCHPDGNSYTVRGTLTTPSDTATNGAGTVDLYQHGLAAGEDYWHIPAAGQELGHVEHMALKGRSSLSIDRLGYGRSDHPHGDRTCLSSDVSVNHQIVEKLRTGDYRADNTTATRFEQVTMVGHSIGGFIAEAEASLFNDVSQIALLNWNGFTFTPREIKRFPPALARCTAGKTSSPDSVDLFEPDSDSFLDAATDGAYSPEVLERIRETQNPTPCGVTSSIPGSIAALAPQLTRITVPVALFAADGDRDLVMTPHQNSLYPNASSHSFWLQPHAGHYSSLADSAPDLHDALANTLN